MHRPLRVNPYGVPVGVQFGHVNAERIRSRVGGSNSVAYRWYESGQRRNAR